MVRILLILTASAFLATSVFAQRTSARPGSFSVDITGMVRYMQGGTPADKVLIRLESYDSGGSLQEVYTDRSGKFRFSGLRPAQYVVRIHYPGFRDEEQRVDLQTASSSYLIFQLVPETTNSGAATGTISNVEIPPKAHDQFLAAEKALSTSDPARFSTAIGHLQAALKLYPAYFEAELKLGTVYMDAQKWDEAEKSLQQAMGMNAHSPNAYFAMGRVYEWKRQYPDAVKVLQKGLANDAKSWQGHLDLGRVYWKQGDWVHAGPEVGRALQLNPRLAEGHLLAGNILLKARQPENALAEFEAYLRLEPNGEFAGPARDTVTKLKAALERRK
jgi:Tfp pilus assembly protein PilF